MRPLKSLTLEAIVEILTEEFKKVPDKRRAKSVTWEMHDVLMAGFAMMFFQNESLLEFQRRMKKKKGQSNLETILGVKEIPSDTQMREILDEAATEPIRRLVGKLFEKIRQVGWAKRWVSEIEGKDYYTIALDGSEYFHSLKIECEGCLKREYVKGIPHYSHMVVSATIIKSGTHQVLPLDVEEVKNTYGTNKQDCEINAGKRLIERIRKEHRQLRICIIGDDIYSHEPFIEDLRENRCEFVLVAKDTSHLELAEQIQQHQLQGLIEQGSWTSQVGKKIRHYEYRILNQIDLTKSKKVKLNYFEVWERDSSNNLLYHNSWVTDFTVTKYNVCELFLIGRSRWKIENEQFNIQKNHGYHITHNYGHGQHNLSMIFYLLNLLAFISHLILEMGTSLYHEARGSLSRRAFWGDLRTLFDRILFTSWHSLLTFYMDDSVNSSP